MKCELCERSAAVFCDSDQARLCWECDAGVHTANSVAQNHARFVLCHRCESPTLWKATGRTLGLSFCICAPCSASTSRKSNDVLPENIGLGNQRQIDDEAYKGSSYDEDEFRDDEDDGGESIEDDSSENKEDEGDNQVVPWFSPPSQ